MLIHRFRDRLRRQRLAFVRLLFVSLKLLHEFVSRDVRSITRDSVLVTPYAAATLLHDYVSLARQWFDIKTTDGGNHRLSPSRRPQQHTGDGAALGSRAEDSVASTPKISTAAIATLALLRQKI